MILKNIAADCLLSRISDNWIVYLDLQLTQLSNISDKNTQIGLCSVVIGVLVLVIPPLLIYSWNNRYARPAVLQGWVPILLAMFISSGVGIIMSKVAEKYQSVVAFLPIINGLLSFFVFCFLFYCSHTELYL